MVNVNKTILVVTALLLIASLLFCGCAKKAETPPKEAGETDVDKDVSDLDSLDKDINMSDLDGVEKDLEGLDW